MKNFIALIFLSLFYTALFAQQSARPFPEEDIIKKKFFQNKAKIGKPFPDFKHIGDDGILYSKKKLLGKKYYINFWFEGCHPCMEEMDLLNELNLKIKSTGNEFISFTFNSPADVKRIREEHNLNFKIICILRDECERLNPGNGFPTHIIVDEKGNIEYVSTLGETREESFTKIYSLLKIK